MKIVRLTSENIKRLKAVEIEPDGTLQIISGKNGQGKSSVLDSIWLALGGGTAKKETARPIRDGADSAKVELDLGDLIVTREWTSNDKSTLKVSSKDGALYKSPQSMLDALIGRLSFDPLAFTQLSAKDQKAQLLDLVDLDVDVDALDAQSAELYEERKQVGRDGKALGTIEVDDTLPEDETSATDLIREIQEAQRLQSENGQLEYYLAQAQARVDDLQTALAEATQKLAALKARPVHKVPDIAALEARLAKVEDENATIRSNNDARTRNQQADALRDKYTTLTDELKSLEARKSKALSSAKFPVDGLGFDSGGVTYNGIPFSQASSAEQIRVSLAMAMALNPTLRVIRIMDGSLLDSDNMALIEDMAREKDFQIWIERVADGESAGVVIEDGEVA